MKGVTYEVTVELLKTMFVTVVGEAVNVMVEFTGTVPVTVIVAASAVLLARFLASISAALLARISASRLLILE